MIRRGGIIPSAWEHRAYDVPEGEDLDPGLRERLAAEGFEEIGCGRLDTDRGIRASFDRLERATRVVVDPRASF
jgi:hypothetical protein